MSRHGLTNGLSGVAGYWSLSSREATSTLGDVTGRSPTNSGEGARGRGGGGVIGGAGRRNKHSILPTIQEPEVDATSPNEKEDQSLLPLSASATSLSGMPTAAAASTP